MPMDLQHAAAEKFTNGMAIFKEELAAMLAAKGAATEAGEEPVVGKADVEDMVEKMKQRLRDGRGKGSPGGL